MKIRFLPEQINREIDRSTLNSFDGPFQLLHADVEICGKNATFPQYVLVIVDLFS